MEIGKEEEETTIVEPLEDPVPREEPREEPAPAPETALGVMPPMAWRCSTGAWQGRTVAAALS